MHVSLSILSAGVGGGEGVLRLIRGVPIPIPVTVSRFGLLLSKVLAIRRWHMPGRRFIPHVVESTEGRDINLVLYKILYDPGRDGPNGWKNKRAVWLDRGLEVEKE